MALAAFYGTAEVKPFRYRFAWDTEKALDVEATTPFDRREFADFPLKGRTLAVTNTETTTLYVSVYRRGVPPAGVETPSSEGLSIEVRMRDMKMNGLAIDKIIQGLDLVAEVRVKNLTSNRLKNLVLTHLVAAGFQIKNPRFSGEAGPADAVDYQDIRDDRVFTYFGLDGGQEKVFLVVLNASYRGRYYQPGVAVEAMYDAGHPRQHERAMDRDRAMNDKEVRPGLPGADSGERRIRCPAKRLGAGHLRNIFRKWNLFRYLPESTPRADGDWPLDAPPHKSFRFVVWGSAFVILLLGWLAIPVVHFSDPVSPVLFSAEGRLLGARTAADGQWRFPPGERVPERFSRVLVRFEDKRFFAHPGIDLLAVARAARQNLRSGRSRAGPARSPCRSSGWPGRTGPGPISKS